MIGFCGVFPIEIFTHLVHRYLGGRRIPLPTCTYHKIKTTFPEEKSPYAGFETEDIESQAANRH